MESRKAVLVLKGDSKGDVLRVASDEISQGFQNKGYEVITLDLMNLAERSRFNEVLREKEYAFIFACQGTAVGLVRQAKENMKILSDTPYIAWIFDDLMYHCDFLLKVGETDKDIWLLEVDRTMKKIAGWINPFVRQVFHFLHGGFESKQKFKKKDIDILFPGNLGEEPVMEDVLSLSGEDYIIFSDLSYEVIDLLLNRKTELTVREAFKEILNEHQIDYTEQTHLEILATGALRYVDMYIRYYYKKQTLVDLLEEGFSVSVIGEGYEAMKGHYSNLTVYGTRDIKEVTDMMARSKIICNPLPPVFKEGVHERIFSAMLNKAVCLSPYSSYQEELLGDRVLFYRIDKKEEMIRNVRSCIEHFDVLFSSELEEIYLFAKQHTWEKRGEEIIGLYEHQISSLKDMGMIREEDQHERFVSFGSEGRME